MEKVISELEITQVFYSMLGAYFSHYDKDLSAMFAEISAHFLTIDFNEEAKIAFKIATILENYEKSINNNYSQLCQN